MDGDEMVKAKQAFVHIAASYDVTVKHYHCDKGLFTTTVFKKEIARSNQTIYFCGVNTHHKNGKAERAFRDSTDGARTFLLYAAHHRPKAIDTSSLPATLKHYIYITNNIPTEFTPGLNSGRRQLSHEYINSPLSRLSRIEQK